MNMNLRQARVVDPVLSTIALGYKNPACVGNVLFPPVPVKVRGGKVIKFGTEMFQRIEAVRAPGADTRNISFGYQGESYELKQEALDATLPREHVQEAVNVPGIDLGQRAVAIVMRILTNGLEYEQAKLATNPANYGDRTLALAGDAKWSSPDSDPVGDVDRAKEAVRLSAGIEPNRMVISKPIFTALKNHPKIIERFKYTTSNSITTDMLAALFDLQTVAVGRAAMLLEPDDNAKFVDVWGNFAALGYTPDNPAGAEEPSFGYTYTLKGTPMVEMPEWNGSKRSWLYGVTYDRVPVLTGIASGFLFEHVVAEAAPAQVG